MPGTIPVRTERQAMDWSLVLVSQGIEPTIVKDAEADVWRLVVEASDYQRAVQTLRQYVAENRSRVWRQELPWTGLVFDWRCMAPIAAFIFLFAIEATGRGNLSAAGLMSNKAVHAGEWWRIFTAIMLHGDLAHLTANVTTGLVLLGLAMGVYGMGIGLMASFLAGAGGNLAGLLLHSDRHQGLGASGMIMGALGLLAAQWFTLLRHGLTPRQLAIRGLLSGGLLLVLLGFSPDRNVDVLAHVAGFGTGLALGVVLAMCPTRFRQSIFLDRAAFVLCFALASVTWWLALRWFGRV